MGYTTCFWHTVRNSQILSDPHGWFGNLQDMARAPYLPALRQNIIAFNHPVLRAVIPSYLHQIEKAVRRGDLVSINHRLAALLASYFDIIFAFNGVLHPGEKRLVNLALAGCPSLPVKMAADLDDVLHASGTGSTILLEHLTRLLDRLDDWLGPGRAAFLTQ